ncbi:unnamed protein product [Paramecium sonneborni]|uniref:Ubiquitin-like domain-containing protein n=1 Tax=Paramecium sonneborni TaxID=65129 RepID=A0A8S1LAT5_9CILI|nr:unnamed protein product [Paramecium sonneborni]
MNSQLITVIITLQQRNKIYNIEVDPSTKVQELIDEFREMLKPLGTEKLVLWYNNNPLRLEKTFEEQGIRKGSTMNLFIETQGGL